MPALRTDWRRPGLGQYSAGVWMLYGANGFTGTLTAELAQARGLTPILAGRGRTKLEPLGTRLGLEVRIFDLPVSGGTSSAATPSFAPGQSYREIREQFETDFERRYVSWLLDRHAGNISAAAREARMDRKHLYDLARRHGLRGEGKA